MSLFVTVSRKDKTMKKFELTDERLSELRVLAEKATPGPWIADGNEVSQHWSRPEPWETIASSEVACMSYCYGGSGRGIECEEDAVHIAAFDPPTVLALLSELAEYRAREAAGVTDEMVETGARGLTRHYFAEEGIYNPCEAKVTEHTVEPIRDSARAVLEAVLGSRDADAPGDGSTT